VDHRIFLLAGILLNCALIVINRFVVKIPGKIQIPLCLVGIALLIVGLVMVGGDIGCWMKK